MKRTIKIILFAILVLALTTAFCEESTPEEAVVSVVCTPEEAAESTVSTPGEVVELPESTPGEAVEAPENTPEEATESPESTPDEAIEFPASIPEEAIESPESTPEEAVEMPASTPEEAAESPESTPVEVVVSMKSMAGQDIENDLCFYMYTEKLLGFSVPGFYRVSHGFTGVLQEFYDALSSYIREVAAGTRTSTVFRVEKGLTLTQEDFDALINALVVDYPYEMYWYDKTRGVSASGTYSWTEFQFYVAKDYAAGDFSTNPSKINKVQSAVSTAKSIVSKYASRSDGDKLMAYKNEICNLVSYNQAAANDPYGAYGDAYQLIWVFDGDSSTNVVCEGYSKAFQYLCDMTDFSSNVVCITVSGVMSDAYSSGGHMWNIVKMADGYNYLVDVTNCDSGSVGYPDKLFLARYTSGSANEGYVFDLSYSQVAYSYYNSMFSLYGEKRLTLTPKGHLIVIDPAVEATCISSGLTEGSHCEICGEVFVKQESIPSPGHEAETDAAVEATCTSTGLTEGSHCTVCGEVLVKQELIPKKEHTPVIEPAVEPTCTQAGMTEGRYCIVCGEILLAKEAIGSRGHEIVIDEAVEATCTSTGLTEGRYCSVCGEVLKKQEIVPAKEHSIVTDAAVAPSCGREGLTEGSHCGVCGEVFVGQEILAPLDHRLVIDPAVKATCTQTGLTKGSHCELCNEVIKAQEIIPELGHWVETDAAVEPTCTVYGLTDGSHCVRCFEILAAQEILNPLGHETIEILAVEATCTGDGLTEGSYCARCGEVFKEQQIIPAMGHDDGAWATVYDATYEAEGLRERRCTACAFVLESEIIPKKDETSDKRLPGDVNGDGKLSIADLLMLARYIAGYDEKINLSNASVDGVDGISVTDLLMVARYFGGHDIILQ